MESILGRALEYTLKYWLKSFSREQLKWHGRTVQLSNLEINGNALHSSLGLAPALNVTTANVGKLEIVLPYISNVQIEPVVVQIDRLDLVLKENADLDVNSNSTSAQSSSSSGKGNGYGFADKISDGMTLEVRTINILLETRASAQIGAVAWASPLAAVTIRNLILFSTNGNWQVVSLKDAREFSRDKEFLYVFRKLEWESLSVDLLPHPDMFVDRNLAISEEEAKSSDEDRAKRIFFGGERLLEGISGQAYITVQRTLLNSPLGFEVNVHIPEVVCPSISEPGLRAFLRFMVGLHACLSRGDVDLNSEKQRSNAPGNSVISIIVDHIFLCIKDAGFQLELLMQSLFFSRANFRDAEVSRNLTKIILAGFFLRDTFSRPHCTLIQPSMQGLSCDSPKIPDFAENFYTPIFPLGRLNRPVNVGIPLLTIHSLQVMPSLRPPSFSLQTAINCQPLLICLQEDSCLRVCSFLADGVSVNAGVLPDSFMSSFSFCLKELDLSIPVDTKVCSSVKVRSTSSSMFAGARLHVETLHFSESPRLGLHFLHLEKDPACFSLWEGQPVDTSLKKWSGKIAHFSLSLEMVNSFSKLQNHVDWPVGLWKCVEINDICVEVAMATSDGSPLITVPPPGGIFRVGIVFSEYVSNTSIEQLFFVLDLYMYFSKVGERMSKIRKSYNLQIAKTDFSRGSLMDKAPSDTALCLGLEYVRFKFLEPSTDIHGMPLVQFVGDNFNMKVSHKSLGGAIVITSKWQWDRLNVDCFNPEESCASDQSQTRSVVWANKGQRDNVNVRAPKNRFLDISMVHVIPYTLGDSDFHTLTFSACIYGVHLAGGMHYTEIMLHRFGIIGSDGCPGQEFSEIMDNLLSGKLAKLFGLSSIILEENSDSSSRNGEKFQSQHLGIPIDVDISIELKDWSFSLQGTRDTEDRWSSAEHTEDRNKETCWKTIFQSLLIKGKSNSLNARASDIKRPEVDNMPFEFVTIGVKGLKILKPVGDVDDDNGMMTFGGCGIMDFEIVISPHRQTSEWTVDAFKFCTDKPIQVRMIKDEVRHLIFLCRSELDALGRITAAVLLMLRIERSVGHVACIIIIIIIIIAPGGDPARARTWWPEQGLWGAPWWAGGSRSGAATHRDPQRARQRCLGLAGRG